MFLCVILGSVWFLCVILEISVGVGETASDWGCVYESLHGGMRIPGVACKGWSYIAYTRLVPGR